MAVNFHVIIILIVQFFLCECSDKDSTEKCESQYMLKQHYIIDTKESLRRGANFIYVYHAKDARSCSIICCRLHSCTAVIYEMDKLHPRSEHAKNCFAFACGPDASLCSFAPHANFLTLISTAASEATNYAADYGIETQGLDHDSLPFGLAPVSKPGPDQASPRIGPVSKSLITTTTGTPSTNPTTTAATRGSTSPYVSSTTSVQPSKFKDQRYLLYDRAHRIPADQSYSLDTPSWLKNILASGPGSRNLSGGDPLADLSPEDRRVFQPEAWPRNRLSLTDVDFDPGPDPARERSLRFGTGYGYGTRVVQSPPPSYGYEMGGPMARLGGLYEDGGSDYSAQSIDRSYPRSYYANARLPQGLSRIPYPPKDLSWNGRSQPYPQNEPNQLASVPLGRIPQTYPALLDRIPQTYPAPERFKAYDDGSFRNKDRSNSTRDRTCNPAYEFRCRTGDPACIAVYDVCDKIAHCQDGSDEVDCPRYTNYKGSQDHPQGSESSQGSNKEGTGGNGAGVVDKSPSQSSNRKSPMDTSSEIKSTKVIVETSRRRTVVAMGLGLCLAIAALCLATVACVSRVYRSHSKQRSSHKDYNRRSGRGKKRQHYVNGFDGGPYGRADETSWKPLLGDHFDTVTEPGRVLADDADQLMGEDGDDALDLGMRYGTSRSESGEAESASVKIFPPGLTKSTFFKPKNGLLWGQVRRSNGNALHTSPSPYSNS